MRYVLASALPLFRQPDWMLQKNDSPTYPFMCLTDISDLPQTLASRLTSPWNFPALFHVLSLGCFLFGFFLEKDHVCLFSAICADIWYMQWDCHCSKSLTGYFERKDVTKTVLFLYFLVPSKEVIARATCCASPSAWLACLYFSFLCFVVALLAVNYHLACFSSI